MGLTEKLKYWLEVERTGAAAGAEPPTRLKEHILLLDRMLRDYRWNLSGNEDEPPLPGARPEEPRRSGIWRRGAAAPHPPPPPRPTLATAPEAPPGAPSAPARAPAPQRAMPCEEASKLDAEMYARIEAARGALQRLAEERQKLIRIAQKMRQDLDAAERTERELRAWRRAERGPSSGEHPPAEDRS